MALPKVSIITPSFNSARYIQKTIESVLSQDYHPLEYIIVDGESTDNTIEILNTYDNRIHWISEPDNGMTEALNKGFRMAEGEYLGWINADDLYATRAVAMSIEFLVSNPEAAAVYSNGELIDQDGNLIKPLIAREFSLKELLLGNYYICQPTLFFRRKILEQLGWLDEQFPQFTMDLDLLLRLGLNYKIGYNNSLGASFRIHELSKTISQQTANHSEKISTLKKFFNSKNLPVEYLNLRGKSLALAYLNGACQYYNFDQIKHAKENLTEANSYCSEIIKDPDILLPAVVGSLPYGLDPLPMLNLFFENLPSELKYLRRYRNRAINLASIASAFQAHQEGNQAQVRKNLLSAVIRKPSWLTNRGVLSIGLESILGVQNYQVLRKIISLHD